MAEFNSKINFPLNFFNDVNSASIYKGLIWYKNKMRFTIFKRLTIGYAIIMLLIISLGVYITLKLNQLNHLSLQIISIGATNIKITEHLLDDMFSQVGFEKKYLISRDQDFYDKFWEIKEHFTKNMERLEYHMGSTKNRNSISEVKNLYSNYHVLFTKEVEDIKNKRNYTLRKYQQKKEIIIDEINQRLKEIIKNAGSDRDKKIYESSTISSHILKVTTITIGLAIFIGLLISFYNTRSINRSIVLLQKRTRDIAKGKFEEIYDISSPPEIKELADDFNTMCERLKELDEMKRDFISHVSHRLRTPLTAIKEASSMLLEGTYAQAPAKQQELLTITKEECEKLIYSVNRMLDLSRMEAKMMDYQIDQCSLFSVIQKSVLKLAPIAQRKKIDLELKPPPDLPLVKIDEEQISQVMENLIGNALKFSPAGGKVVINSHIKNDRKRFVEVSVSDTGRGISKENLEIIFDKFSRIDQGKETARGTGLGLSIAKFIIADHGGKIWVESKPGKGSIFFFTLPV